MNILYASRLKSRLSNININRTNTNTTKSSTGVTYPAVPTTRVFNPILDKKLLDILNN